MDGISSDFNPGDGDFHGGFAYPAEQVPPDVQPPLAQSGTMAGPFPPGIAPIVYPAGYFAPLDTPGSQSLRRLPFRYPSKKDNDRNFMFARGQTLPLGRGTYNRLLLLGAATENTTGAITLNYADGTSASVPLSVSSWTTGPQNNEPIALECTFRRSATADEMSKAYLYVYEVPADSNKVLENIVFPNNRAIRICAITADEKPGITLPRP